MLKHIVRLCIVSLLAAGTASFAQDGAATYKAKCQMCHGEKGDGKGDLVTVWPNGGLSYAQVALSNGKTFSQATNSPVGTWDDSWVDMAGDVNADGKSDLVILRQDATLSGWNARGQVLWSSCTMGVCGDGVCQGYETFSSCPADCKLAARR